MKTMPVEDQIKFVKQCRVNLDQVLQALKDELPLSNEKLIAETKITEAIMWLGMELKLLGAGNPYPNSYNPSNAVVDKTADGLKL